MSTSGPGNVEIQIFARCRACTRRLTRVPIRATMWYIEAEWRSLAVTCPPGRVPCLGDRYARLSPHAVCKQEDKFEFDDPELAHSAVGNSG